MTAAVVEMYGVLVLVCEPDGPVLGDESAALDLIGEALGQGAELVVVPAHRMADEFFALRSGLAGAVAQKFVNYRLRLAVVGDISAQVARSTALRDFVFETNRGNQLWFLATQGELAERLRERHLRRSISE